MSYLGEENAKEAYNIADQIEKFYIDRDLNEINYSEISSGMDHFEYDEESKNFINEIINEITDTKNMTDYIQIEDKLNAYDNTYKKTGWKEILKNSIKKIIVPKINKNDKEEEQYKFFIEYDVLKVFKEYIMKYGLEKAKSYPKNKN